MAQSVSARKGIPAIKELYELAAHSTGEKLREALKRCDKPVDSLRKPMTGNMCGHKVTVGVGPTLLQGACLSGNDSCAGALLDLGASLSAEVLSSIRHHVMELRTRMSGCFETDDDRETCMHLAAASGNGPGKIVRLLEAAGMDVNARSGKGRTPLMAAAERFGKLLEWTVKFTSRKEENIGKLREDLLKLCQQESATVQTLISSGADMDARCVPVYRGDLYPEGIKRKIFHQYYCKSEGLTALHMAVCTGDYGVARSLVAAGADVNARTNAGRWYDSGQTPLHFAVSLLDVKMVKLLLAGGADVNAEDSHHSMPLQQVFAMSESLTPASPWQTTSCGGNPQSHTQRSLSRTSRHVEDPFTSLKSSRAAVVEVLLYAGANRNGRGAVLPSNESDMIYHPLIYDHQPEFNDEGKYHSLSVLAELNPNSGGPEVLELLSTVWAQPHSLQSFCRLAIRKQLQRPILRQDNVESLPLPGIMKSYVSMSIAEEGDSELISDN